MSKKFKGYSLVAHDVSAASILGIITLDEAKGRDAFGPNCKHATKPLPQSIYNQIDLLLNIAESEPVKFKEAG